MGSNIKSISRSCSLWLRGARPTAGSILISLICGVLLGLTSAPVQWWWVVAPALGLLYRHLDGQPWQQRLLRSWIAFAAMFLFSLSWTRQFSIAGWLILAIVESAFYAIACIGVPMSGNWRRCAAFTGALVLAEALRTRIPLGGLPMGSFASGQVHGPLATSAASIGELGVIGLAGLCGVATSELLRARRSTGRWLVAFAAIVTVAGVTSWGSTRDVGRPARSALRVAAVQAGGPQAVPSRQQAPAEVFAGHYLTTATVEDPVDLIIWPEDVIQVNGDIAASKSSEIMAGLAKSHNATVIAGVVEVMPNQRFHNEVVEWKPTGEIGDRYEKHFRVPFGEYVPARSWISKLADFGEVPDDAYIGHGPQVLRDTDKTYGVSVSYEGLFSRHGRQATRHGGEILLVPTNAASYKDASVAEGQLDAARMRAIENRRWVVQVAPTGITAVIDDRGAVRSRTKVGDRAVIRDTARLASGETWYSRHGDAPIVTAAIAALVLAWVRSASRSVRRAQDPDPLHDERTSGD